MYSTAWCGYCKKARKYFTSKGIAFIEYDIEKNARAKRDYDALGGKGVPVILVGKKRMNGFSPQGFDRIYKS
jgi:glutaredoxin-like YruB-family protein